MESPLSPTNGGPDTTEDTRTSTPSTKLVPAVCTQCGGALEVDPLQEAAVCQFCRTPFIVESAIAKYVSQTTIEHADTVVNGADTVNVHQSGVASVVGFVERQLKRKQDKEDAQEREAAARAEEERRALAAMPPLQRVFKKSGALIVSIAVVIIGMIFLSVMAAVSATPDENGFITMPSASSSFRGKDYHAVVEDLTDRGFTNVASRPLGDLVTGWIDKPDEVDKVTVAGNPDYSTSKRFPPNVEIVVYYHSFPDEDADASANDTAGEPEASAPSASAAPEPGATSDAVAGGTEFAQQIRTRFLEAWGVDSELDLLGAYLVDPVAPSYAITSWESVGSQVRVHVQEDISADEARAIGKQILGLTCGDFPSFSGVIVQGTNRLDINVPRSAMPLCTM